MILPLVGIGRGTNNGVIVQVADGGEFPFTVSKGLFGASEFLLQAVAGVAAGDGTFTVGNGIGSTKMSARIILWTSKNLTSLVPGTKLIRVLCVRISLKYSQEISSIK